MPAHPIQKLFDNAQAMIGPSADLPVLVPSTFNSFKGSTSPKVLDTREARIVGYARRSSKKEGNDSIDRQFRGLQDYAQRKLGRPLDHFYSDASISGRTWKRPGLQQLMADAEQGRFTHIIVEDVDRIARALHIAAEFKHKCDGWNVKIHSAYKGDEIDDSDVAFRGFLSADQVSLMRERSMQGRRKKAEKGSASQMPFGYVRASHSNQWKIDETKRELIEAIFDARIDGMEYSVIARILNAREIIEKSGEGKWRPNAIKDILYNPKYMGVHIYGLVKKRFDPDTGRTTIESGSTEDLVVSEMPEWAIVSKEKWHLAFQSHERRTYQTLKRDHLLLSSEHAVCATCGKKLGSVRVGKSDEWVLRCKVRDCPESFSYHAKNVEEQMLQAVRLVLTDPVYDASFDAQLDIQYDRISRELADRRNAIENRIQELDNDLEDLLDQGLDLKKRRKLDTDDERDELHAFEAERIARRANKSRAELQAARLQLTMLPSSPTKPDLGKRARLLQAFDRIVEARNSAEPRSNVEDELYTAAQTAIGNLVETIKVGSVYPGRATRYEVVLRLQPVYGDMANLIDDGRRTIVTIVHPKHLGASDEGLVREKTSEAFRSRVLAATEDEFLAIDPAISPRIRGMLARVSWTTRSFIDLVFLSTRASTTPEFLRHVLPSNISRSVQNAFRMSMLENDGTWDRIFTIVKNNFPNLYQTMNHTAFPIHANNYSKLRKAQSLRNRNKSRNLSE